jgi:hypothetical protein
LSNAALDKATIPSLYGSMPTAESFSGKLILSGKFWQSTLMTLLKIGHVGHVVKIICCHSQLQHCTTAVVKDGVQEKLDAASVLMSKYIVMAAKIVAPRINPSSTEAGFQWCMDEVMRAKLPEFAHGVLMAKAAHFLAAGEMDKAVTVLKQFEKHSGAARTRAATNLSFIYLLEGNIDEAERYANMAKQNDEYHTQVSSSSSKAASNRFRHLKYSVRI